MELERTDKAGAHRLTRDDLPPLGSWHWCRFKGTRDGDEAPDSDGDGVKRLAETNAVEPEELCCVEHVASNYIRVGFYRGGKHWTHRYTFNEFLDYTRPAPEWREVIQQNVVETQKQLQLAVMAIADLCTSACLIKEDGGTTSTAETFALTARRESPEQAKRALMKLKDEDYPAAQERVEALTQQMVGLQKCLVLGDRSRMEKLEKAMAGVDERLFALELYAGLVETVTCIRKGTPAPQDTPITIRQMLRYMDEETLFNFENGGMDFRNLKDFDKWVARDENLNRIAPEPRCVVALQIRRHEKDYGYCNELAIAWKHMEWNQANKKTYLLMRNGSMVWRLECDQDFKPRLLPLRDELHQPFENQRYSHKADDYVKTTITPDSFEYDEHAERRRATMMQYNRIMFLLQGILDRSKVFSPHPLITLSNPDHLDQFVRLNYDEQDGLPSVNPPVWEVYRDDKNKAVRRGSVVYCAAPEEKSERYNRFAGSYEHPKYGHDAARRPTICRVCRVSKDRKIVTLRWELGDRIAEHWVIDKTRPVPDKPGWFYRKCITENKGMRYGHQRVEMTEVFAVEAYRPGDYKPFLCDAYQKGRYMRWAGPLLSAERWHMDRVAAENKTVKEHEHNADTE